MGLIEKQEFITVGQAMSLSNVTRPTVINWCRDYGIGYKIGGRWQVDKVKLNKMLDGTYHFKNEYGDYYENK